MTKLPLYSHFHASKAVWLWMVARLVAVFWEVSYGVCVCVCVCVIVESMEGGEDEVVGCSGRGRGWRRGGCGCTRWWGGDMHRCCKCVLSGWHQLRNWCLGYEGNDIGYDTNVVGYFVFFTLCFFLQVNELLAGRRSCRRSCVSPQLVKVVGQSCWFLRRSEFFLRWIIWLYVNG